MSQPPNDNFQHGGVHSDTDEYDPSQDPNWDVSTSSDPHDPEELDRVAIQGNALDEAKRIAGQVVDICDHNFVELNQKKYLKLEAWQAIAYAAGTVPGILIVKDSMIAGVAGVMARSTLKDSKGKTLSEAEGFVGSDEDFWQRQPVQSRVNMAQTRAVSRVCRLVFSFIVQVMNQEYGRQYEVTPADEMQAVQQARQQPPQQPQAPQMGQRHLMQPQGPPFQQQPPQTVVYPNPQAWNQQPPQPQQFPNQPPQPQQGPRNYQLGAQSTWQGILQNVEIKWVQTQKGQSQMFIVHLATGQNGTTFDKKLAAAATANIGATVELGISERTNRPGSYNVLSMRVL